MGLKLFEELKPRLALYGDDWKQGLHMKTISSVLFMFFTSMGPAITFGGQMTDRTGGQLGTGEVILATAVCGVFYSIFSGQPLVIVGVTGPITIFTTTVYRLCLEFDLAFIPWMAWISLWTALMHIIIALIGGFGKYCSLVKYVTAFSCDVFGFLIAIIYIVDACEALALIFEHSSVNAALVSLILCFGTFLLAMTLHSARGWALFRPMIRNIIAEYGVAFSAILFTAVSYIPKFYTPDLPRLAVPLVFSTTSGRSWFPDFLSIPLWGIFAAALPALVLTALFYFDHNVSSLLSQRVEFRLKKPAAYNWDLFVLGWTIVISGLLGIPPTNGLIPQAPLHVRSCATIVEESDGRHTKERYVSVQENRLTNLLQAGTQGNMLAVLFLLALFPKGVLAGVFLYMGFSSFYGNGLAERLMLVLTDTSRAPEAPYASLTRKEIHLFTFIQLMAWGAIFGLTRTPGAIAFPVCIILLVPLRLFLLPRIFSENALSRLDAPMIETPSTGSESTDENNLSPSLVMGGADDSDIMLTEISVSDREGPSPVVPDYKHHPHQHHHHVDEGMNERRHSVHGTASNDEQDL